jgi:chromosome segregation ATPase
VRHLHAHRLAGDLYVLVKLKAETEEIRVDMHELLDARWMGRDEIERPPAEARAGKPIGYKFQLEEARKERARLEEEITQLRSAVNTSETARDQVIAKIYTALEEKNKDLAALRKEKEVREKERSDAQAELTAARGELEEATKKVVSLRKEVQEQQDTVNAQVDRSSKLAAELHERESFLAIANERKAQLEKQVANARLLLQQSGLSIDSLPRDSVPKVSGVVTAVADNSVEVSLGGDDGLQMGHELDVSIVQEAAEPALADEVTDCQ